MCLYCDYTAANCADHHSVLQSFLSDYGLIWVGDGASGDSAESDQAQSAGRGHLQPGSFYLPTSL